MNPVHPQVERAAPGGAGRRTRLLPVALTTLAALAALATVWTPALQAGGWREEFSSDPLAGGWRIHGNSAGFAWDEATGRLQVVWDSTRPNAFFYRPLGTVLARDDSFEFGCALGLDEIRTASGGGTFQLAIGLLRQAEAFRPEFFRGAGTHPVWGPRNLVEFDYFPASAAITPTFSAVAVGSTNAYWDWATVDLFPFELDPGHRFEIRVRYEAAGGTLRLEVRRDGERIAEGSRVLGGRFGDFRVDAFSVTSYSGEHQPANYGGQILARGWVDEVEVTYPNPPAPAASIAVTDGGVRVGLGPVPDGWRPRLERSTDAGEWSRLPGEAELTAAGWSLVDPAPPPGAALYRVNLDRP